MGSNRKKRKGFTLIELLVVIAIIALLLSIVMPGLNMAKRKAASIVCMTNAKNLSLGWFAYKEDNSDRIMSSRMDGLNNPQGNFVPGWINTPHTDESNPTGTKLNCVGTNVVTDEDEARGIRAGALYPYLKSIDVFNCPADKVKALPKYDTVDPEKFVTFAVSECLGGYITDSTLNGKNIIWKYDRITSPSDRYNFVETAEERNWIWEGHFVFGGSEFSGGGPAVWWGPMAVNHGASSVLGFCDGHAEVHKWQDSWTKDRVAKLSEMGEDSYNRDTNSGHNSDNSVDIAFMAKGWAYRYKK